MPKTMVEKFLQWIRGIAGFLIFMTAVQNLLPDQKDRKYIQFFLGLVLLLIVCRPLFVAGNLEQEMEQALNRLQLEEEAAAMENVQIQAENFQNQYVTSAYEKEIGRQIRMYLEESGISDASVDVVLKEGTTNEVEWITIRVPVVESSIYQEEQKKARTEMEQKLEKSKTELEKVYGTSKEHMIIEIQE